MSTSHGDGVAPRPQGRSSPRPPAAVTQVSWSPARRLELQEWVRQGRWLGGMARGARWWLGDWLRYGNAQYGERYTVAAAITGYDVQTLMNLVYVASRFDISRRRENVSFSHHAELAALPREAQERWLDRVESESLSLRALRTALRAGRAVSRPAARPNPPATELVCPACGHPFSRPAPAPLGDEQHPPGAGLLHQFELQRP